MVQNISHQLYCKIIYYLFQDLFNCIEFLVATQKFVHGNLKKYQKKVLKIFLNILIQSKKFRNKTISIVFK